MDGVSSRSSDGGIVLQTKQNPEGGTSTHLHLHHLVLALGAEGPLVGQVVVVVGALVAVQGDGVLRQLDDLRTDRRTHGDGDSHIFAAAQIKM